MMLYPEDILIKTGKRLSRPFTLRHATIYSDDGNIFEINGFNFEIRQGSFQTPNSSNSDLIIIHSLKALQGCQVQIYYIR